jgi:hypothetical protein
MIATGQTFRDIRIHIDGCTFIDCTFERCHMVYAGALGVVMEKPNLVDCTWEVQGAARETIGFMKSLYQGGASALVEATFAEIRSGAVNPQAAPAAQPRK